MFGKATNSICDSAVIQVVLYQVFYPCLTPHSGLQQRVNCAGLLVDLPNMVSGHRAFTRHLAGPSGCSDLKSGIFNCNLIVFNIFHGYQRQEEGVYGASHSNYQNTFGKLWDVWELVPSSFAVTSYCQRNAAEQTHFSVCVAQPLKTVFCWRSQLLEKCLHKSQPSRV